MEGLGMGGFEDFGFEVEEFVEIGEKEVVFVKAS
jgi:hypothetical protein